MPTVQTAEVNAMNAEMQKHRKFAEQAKFWMELGKDHCQAALAKLNVVFERMKEGKDKESVAQARSELHQAFIALDEDRQSKFQMRTNVMGVIVTPENDQE